LAALALGADLRVGLYGACVVFAVIMAVLGGRSGADDTVWAACSPGCSASARCS